MLTEPQIRDALADITYRPGWTFTVTRTDWEGLRLRIVAPVDDAARPGHHITLGVDSYLPPIPDVGYLHTWLCWRLWRIEGHEAREWLRVGGVPPFDPHAVP